MKLPDHKAGLFLTHNEHLGYYDTPEEWLANRSPSLPFASAEAEKRAIETNSVWVLQWYPRTPVGFCIVAAPTLEEVLAFAEKVEKEDIE